MSIVEEGARRRARSWRLVGFLALACLLPMPAHAAEEPALLADLHDGAGLDWGSGPERFLAVAAGMAALAALGALRHRRAGRFR